MAVGSSNGAVFCLTGVSVVTVDQVNIESAMLVGDTHGDAGWLYEHVLPTARRNDVEVIVLLIESR